MNWKRNLLSVVTIMIFVILFGLQNIAYAFTDWTGNEKWMGTLIYMKTDEEPNVGYSINDGASSTGAPIYNLVKYESGTATNYTTANIFCLKAGVGFAGQTMTNAKAPYDRSYDMKSEVDISAMQEGNKVLQTIANNTIEEDEKEISCYNAVLAVLDRMYLPGKSTELEKKKLIDTIIQEAKTSSSKNAYTELIAQALTNYDIYSTNNNLAECELTDYALIDEEIKAVQQTVLWYFTNYYKIDETSTDYAELSEHETKYDNIGKSAWFWYKSGTESYTALNNYQPNGKGERDVGTIRMYQAELLYEYMIKEAKKNAEDYADLTSMTGAPITVDTTKSLESKVNGENCIIGPIFVGRNNARPYTSIDFNVKNNGTAVDYQFVNEEGTSIGGNMPIGEEFYISVPKDKANDDLRVTINVNYNDKKMTLWASTKNNKEQPLVEVEPELKNEEFELLLRPQEKPFDLALRKYITKINGKELTTIGEETRVPNIDESTIGTTQTATYKHRKHPVTIKNGDIVTYEITIYNEGEKAGRATEVVDQLPAGLEFVEVVSGNFKEGSYSKTTNTLQLVRKEGETTNLPAYQQGNLVNNGIGSETIEINCKVTATPDKTNRKVLTNIAWIAKEIDADGTEIINQKGKDRDSEPGTIPEITEPKQDNMSDYTGNNNKEDLKDKDYYYKGQQDDDDFEKLILLPEYFDLALRKFITAVNNDPIDKRITVDVSDLNREDENGNMIATTAKYTENKPPVSVAKGDIVTYTLRIYNEGTIDGYAQEITEDVPEGLEFLWSEKEGVDLEADETLTAAEKEAIKSNQDYLWGFEPEDIDENGKVTKVSTNYLAKETAEDNLLTAFGKNDGTKTEEDLKFKDVVVKFQVVSDDTTGKIIRNEAAITDDCDKDGEPVDDRDSTPEEWKEHPDHEDDEDHDYVILQAFDLALRKFIVAVSKDTTIEENEYLRNEEGLYARAPRVDTSKLNTTGEDGKLITTAIYNHTKQPLIVQPNDIVVYMLRVYNEGDVDGYAAEIKDYLPPYLEYVDSDFNKEYGWSISDDGRLATTKYLSADRYLINKAQKDENGKIVLSYQEVPIMCKVSENPKTNENITNIAEISEYQDENKKPANDRDSDDDNVKPNIPEDKDLPGYKGNETGDYIPGNEDDDDFEKVVVKIFDLALRKWVTEAIVIENGQQTVTQTGHDPWDDPEDVVKVELHRKKINQVTVKFRYSIRIYNQGEIAGYAKEITDYVPEGLRFVAEDNPGWTDEGNNVISTRLLENTLLQPGEYADVDVLLTWINNENNMGLKTNTAEISEDYNEYGVPDIDSTPDNKKPGEDDIDDAPVMLSLTTGQARIYLSLGFVILITIAGGIILIKKYVL